MESDKYDSRDIIWVSDREDTVSIKSVGNSIEVKGRDTGVAKVTAKLHDGDKKTCYVTVIDYLLLISVQFNYTFRFIDFTF